MILAVDTSGATGAALVDERGEVVAVERSDDPRGHAPRELSNGQKQRTALARALADILDDR